MAALFNPEYRRGGPVKWGLISYTAVMFSAVTVLTAVGLNNESISYIDNREFSDVGSVLPPGPDGYQLSISREARSVVPNVMFFINSWLADGLLVSFCQCYVHPSGRLTPTSLALPLLCCLLHEPLGHRLPLPHVPRLDRYVFDFSTTPAALVQANVVPIAMGITFVYQLQSTQQMSNVWSALPYFSISLSLNVILTLAIVIRLILHTRNVRTALGGSGIGGMCKTIITMLVESCTLYAVSSLLVIGPWGVGNPIVNFFLSILEETQVCTFLQPRFRTRHLM